MSKPLSDGPSLLQRLQPRQQIRRLFSTARGALRSALGEDLTQGPRRAGAPRLLFLVNMDPEGMGGLIDSVQAFLEHSRYQVDVVNLRFSYWCWGRFLPKKFPLHDYDVLMLHPTVSHRPEYIRRFAENLEQSLETFPGLKVAQLQDEQCETHLRAKVLGEHRFDLIVTCVPPHEVRIAYPEKLLPDAEFFHCLTGYVTEAMHNLSYSWDAPRPLDLSYRGNKVPFHFGRLPYEKYALAGRFQKICRQRGLQGDVSGEWYHRVYGKAWFDLMGSSKGVLGTESGSRSFDPEGAVARACQKMLQEHPDSTFEEVFEQAIAPHHLVVDYLQISPRIFEAIGCRAVQVLYEGNYSEILKPGVHYLSLKWDHSNLDEVLSQLLDSSVRKRIPEQAFEEILKNPIYQYSSFVKAMEDRFEQTSGRLGKSPL